MKAIAAGVTAVAMLVAGVGLVGQGARAQKAAVRNEPNSGRPVAETVGEKGDDIRGTWETETTVTRSVDGEPQRPLKVREKWVISKGRIDVVPGDETARANLHTDTSYRYTLDPSKSPKEIELDSPIGGPLPGIYRLDGDAMQVCYGFDRRPTRFADDPAAGVMLVDLRRLRRTPERVVQRFANAPGCWWVARPSQPGVTTGTRAGLVMMTEKSPDGSLQVIVAHPGGVEAMGKPAGTEFRPVAFDKAGGRHLLTPSGGASGGNVRTGYSVAIAKYRLDPAVLPAEKVDAVGVEEVTPEARLAVASEAYRKAKATGLELLPTPEVGKPYEFTLTTMNGKPIRSRDLRGKVVLVDGWASWCSPCMAKMASLKALYEKRRGDGFEIVGVCFDQDAGRGKGAIERHGLSWPQVLVPAEQETRDLWEEAGQIESLPHLLVIDREGILRSVGGVEDLEKTIAEWLDRGR